MKKKYSSIILLIAVLLFSFNAVAQIDAVDDIGIPINGPIGGLAVANVLSNDTLNGNPANLSNVNLSLISSTSSNITLNFSDGSVNIAPGTPNGTYTIVYQICDKLNVTQCDTATITLTVTSIISVTLEDIYLDSSIPNGCSVGDVIVYYITVYNSGSLPLSNITITNNNSSNITISGSLSSLAPGESNSTAFTSNYTITQADIDAGRVITSIVASATSSNGTESATSIDPTPCNCNSPILCNTCTITLLMDANPLNIGVVGTYTDYNNDGFVNLGDVINYQITLTNNGSTAMTNLTACQYSMTVSEGTLASLAAGTSNGTFFTGVHVITQAEINAGNVFGYICICVDSFQNCLDGITTSLSQFNGVKLQAFVDSNSNGIKDASENFLPFGNFNYSTNGGATTNLYSSNGVAYLYESNPTTTYNFSYTVPNFYYSCPTQYNNITVPNGSGITTYNFPVIETPYTDVAVYLNRSGGPRPGSSYYPYIQIKNIGNQTITSGTVTFTKDNALTIAALPSGATATTNGFTYNFTNLLPNEFRNIYMLLQVPTIPTVAIGQLLTNTASITIPSGDAYVNNNTSTLIQDIRASYDPNDKQENHGGKILHSSFTTNDYLTYTIQFENTGNANAINVKVDDVLDSKLDGTSIVMVASSDDYILNRVGNNLSWRFNGINLPPSVPNTQTGHGYITFQIKPKPGYAIGDIIPNVANIFFDSNPAIVTNVCNTQFVSTLQNDGFAFSDFNFYPNPVKNSLTISNADTIDEVEITSILGQKMIVKSVNDLQTEIDLSELSNGVYFVKVTSEGQEKIVKIVKE